MPEAGLQLWGADAARKEAFSCSFDKLGSTMALLAKFPYLSQNDCLPERGWSGGGLPNIADLRDNYEAIWKSGWRAIFDKMIPLRGSEPAAEVKKAGSASDDTPRMPKPLSRIGSPDWFHLLSGKEQCVILHTADLNILSNVSRVSCITDGEHFNRCWTLGALNDARSKTKAFWAPNRLKRSTALSSSASLADQARSNSGPVYNRVPRGEASSTLRRVKDWSIGSTKSVLVLQTNSYLLMLRDKPMLSPSSLIQSMFAATSLWLSPTVRSSR